VAGVAAAGSRVGVRALAPGGQGENRRAQRLQVADGNFPRGSSVDTAPAKSARWRPARP
jgi:hypothetical protein